MGEKFNEKKNSSNCHVFFNGFFSRKKSLPSFLVVKWMNEWFKLKFVFFLKVTSGQHFIWSLVDGLLHTQKKSFFPLVKIIIMFLSLDVYQWKSIIVIILLVFKYRNMNFFLKGKIKHSFHDDDDEFFIFSPNFNHIFNYKKNYFSFSHRYKWN